MTVPLRYNTASQEIPLGHFLDSGDGDTEENGLTIANTDIKLWKSGATTLANKASGGATNISNGIWYCVLDATDTNTYGPMVVFVHVAGALAVRVECAVMEATAYDALYAALGTGSIEADAVAISGDSGAADNLELDYDGTGLTRANSVIGTATAVTDMVTANMIQISGSAAAADALEASALTIGIGLAETGTLSTTQATTDLTQADNFWIGHVIKFHTGPLTGQASEVTAYANATGLLTFVAMTTAPLNGNAFVLL